MGVVALNMREKVPLPLPTAKKKKKKKKKTFPRKSTLLGRKTIFVFGMTKK